MDVVVTEGLVKKYRGVKALRELAFERREVEIVPSKGGDGKVIPFLLVLLSVSICIPQVCSADTIFDRFSGGEWPEGYFGLNYQSKIMIFNITSGTKTEKYGSIGGYIDCRVYDQYINITEFRKQWYTVDRSRRINGTDMRIMWWIDTNVHIGNTVRILNDSFIVVGKGVQELQEYHGVVRICWILSWNNSVAYYDTEYGLLITLINITQIEGDVARGTVIFLSSPDSPKLEGVISKSMAAHFQTTFPPLITFTILVSAFVLTKYHLLRRIRLWLGRIKR